MARWAQRDKMTRVVTVEQITGKMDGMELQRLVVFSTCGANTLNLLSPRRFRLLIYETCIRSKLTRKGGPPGQPESPRSST